MTSQPASALRAPRRQVRMTVNGEPVEADVEDRMLLADFVRDSAGLKGTHIGCRNGDCGACTLRIDGEIYKSCLILAVSVAGREIETIDGLGQPGNLHPVQQAFWDADGFQCGFCTPGHVFAAVDLLKETSAPTREEISQALAGNLCRCTGYQNIVRAVERAAALLENQDDVAAEPHAS